MRGPDPRGTAEKEAFTVGPIKAPATAGDHGGTGCDQPHGERGKDCDGLRGRGYCGGAGGPRAVATGQRIGRRGRKNHAGLLSYYREREAAP